MKLKLLIFLLLSCQSLYSQTTLSGMPTVNGGVWAILRLGNTVYIGGDFTLVNGVARKYIASFDATTGALSTWNPGINRGVYAIERAGQKLIVGGQFDTVASQRKAGICIFDLATGNLDSWAPLPNAGTVQAICSFGNLFYFTGFTGTGSGYMQLYCVDGSSGTYNSWHSDSLSDNAKALVLSGNYIYFGGNILRRFSTTTGADDGSWHPTLSSNGFINKIVKIDSVIYIGGSYTTINGQSRNGLSCFNPSGNLSSFNVASSSSQVWALFPEGDYLWIGGNSSSYGGQTRIRMAQINIATQTATCWNHSSFAGGWSFVNAIFVAGDTVYAAPSGTSGITGIKVFVFHALFHPAVTIYPGGSTLICQGSSVLLHASHSAGLSYQWELNGVSIPGAVLYDYAAADSGNYSCLVTNSCYKVRSNSIIVTKRNATFSAQIATVGPALICQGSITTINAVPAGPGYSYQWLFNNLTLSGANTPLYNSNQPGSYQCIVSDTACSMRSNTIPIYVFGIDSLVLQPNGSLGMDAFTTYSSPGQGQLSVQPNTLNFGDSTDFPIGYSSYAGGQPEGYMQSLIRFDFSIFPSTTLVQNAKFTLFNNPISLINSGISNGYPTSCYVMKITSPWQEDIVTSSNQPSYTAVGAVAIPSASTLTGNQDCTVNVTGLVQDMVSNPQNNYGFFISPTASTLSPNRILVFSSSDNVDSTNWPKMVVYVYDSITRIVANGPSVICPGQNTVLSVYSIVPGCSYQWRVNGSIIPGATGSSYSVTLSGVYSCEIFASSCSRISNSIAVTLLSDCSIPIAWYTLDNNANDVSGNNYNGTPHSLTTAANVCSQANSAYNFNGSGQYISIPTSGFLLNEYTYSAWCKPSVIPPSGNLYCIMAIGGSASDQFLLLYNNPGAGSIGFGAVSYDANNQGHGCYTGVLPSLNQWYHLVATRNNSTLKFYVNDTLICSSPAGNLDAGYGGTSIVGSIGSREGSSSGNFRGVIDDVRIYNRVLSLSEIQSIPAPCTLNLNLRLFIQGFYIGNSSMIAAIDPVNFSAISDSVTIELHNSSLPYALFASKKGVIGTNGYGSFTFPPNVLGNSYYIVVRHRTALETWSKNPVLFNSNLVSFDFTSP